MQMKGRFMIHGLSHVDVPVRDIDRALSLYVGVLGFALRSRGEGWADLDAHSAGVRLVESQGVERPASIRLLSSGVEADVEALVSAGVTLQYEPARTDRLTLEATMQDSDGNTLTLWRDLTEDEYGFDPVLPTVVTWDEDAETLLKSLLRAVPALFRGLARRRIVAEAERRVGARKRISRDLAIRSFISAQSPPNRKRLNEPLRAHGINPAHYKDEFDA
jgi:catechol 2,3-dioxygenase-like lactoylglutathione lyase family enzyme